MDNRDAEIIEAISRAEKCLAQLDAERVKVTSLLAELRHELASLDSPPSTVSETSELSPSEKISLFRSLFKGREDVLH